MLDRLLTWCARFPADTPWMLQVRSFADDHDGWVLTLEGPNPDDEDADDVWWEIRADGAREYALRSATVESVAVVTEHPLLLPHVAPPAELHVGAPPRDADRLYARLVRAHRRLVGSWLPLEHVMTDHPALKGEAVPDGDLVLARGPLPVLEAYAAVAREEGMQPRLLAGPAPAGIGTEPPHLLLLDDSWCIAARFTCRQGVVD